MNIVAYQHLVPLRGWFPFLLFAFNLFPEIVLQVTLIAQGDVLLSVVMTLCSTLGAVLLTPLLTLLLAGTYAPIDAVKLSFSTLQVWNAFLFLVRKGGEV